MTNHSLFKMLPLAAATVLFGAGSAQAMTIAIDDLSTVGVDMVVNDGGVGDGLKRPGKMSVSDIIGVWDFTLSATSSGGGNLSLGGVDIISSSAPGTLKISVWDTYTPTAGDLSGFLGSAGATLRVNGNEGFLDATYRQYVAGTAATDSGRLAGASTLGLTGLDASATSPFIHAEPGVSYDLRIDVLITHNSPATTTFSSTITPHNYIPPVPIPAAALLFGSGLLGMVGMVGMGRRKIAQG